MAIPYDRGRGSKRSHPIQSWTREAHGHDSGLVVHLNSTYGSTLARTASAATIVCWTSVQGCHPRDCGIDRYCRRASGGNCEECPGDVARA
jgi:hypothetical protein